MAPLVKTILIASIVSGVVIIGLTTGLTLGLKNTPS
jgi:predicted transporter